MGKTSPPGHGSENSNSGGNRTNFMKKIATILVLGAILGGILAGCSGSGEAEAPANNAGDAGAANSAEGS